MCEICKSEGQDSAFLNGTKNQLVTQMLYKVYRNNVAPVKLCYIHSIELFMLGEKRFLRKHLSFAYTLATRSKKLSAVAESPFGF